MNSHFATVAAGAPIEVFAVNKAYQEDTFPKKVNLSIGAYRTEEEKPWVLPVVQKVERQIANDDKTKIMSPENPLIIGNKTISVQCLSGTGALRIGAEFLSRCCDFKTVYVSDPTWENHMLLFDYAGFKDIRTYRYWDNMERKIDINGLIEDLKRAPTKSVVVLHACAHNPTGMDPSEDEWKEIANVIEEKNHFPFFDCAYQGFASGDTTRDAFAIRYFAKRGFEFICAQSFAKNFGLYNERIGNLTLAVKDVHIIPAVKSQLTLLVRAMYSNPPVHGARIVSMVLNNQNLFEEWKECIKTMADRILLMRKMLRDQLVTLQTPGNWDHITKQIGMFSFTGLTPVQVDHLTREHHVYLLRNGRINMCGLTTANVEYVAKAINDAVSKFPSKY
uniref:Aspartate aminotransferase n=1 Tax=Strigamia maritima TaxID=126957 RepID=T1IIZ1_STRMM